MDKVKKFTRMAKEFAREYKKRGDGELTGLSSDLGIPCVQLQGGRAGVEKLFPGSEISARTVESHGFIEYSVMHDGVLFFSIENI